MCVLIMSDAEKIENRGGDRYPEDKSNNAEWLSSKGGVRCSRTKKDGNRCSKWAITGCEYCRVHGGSSLSNTPMYQFRRKETEEAFLRFRHKEDYLSIQDELAIIRMCLEALIKNYEKAVKKNGTISAEAALVLADLSKSVAQVAKDCNTIERGLSVHISLETLEMWLGQITQTLTECGASDDMVCDFIEKIGKLQMPIGGRMTLRELAEEADKDEDDEEEPKETPIYDSELDDEEVSAPIARATAAPNKSNGKTKARQDRDKPRNKRDKPRGTKQKHSKVKRRKQ